MIIDIVKGISVPFLGTTLGAFCVFFLKNELSKGMQKALMGFAAGAMFYVVVEELVPKMSVGKSVNVGFFMFSVGFTMMMILDVALA